MSPEAFDRACLALPAAALDHPFGPDDHVFKVGGKMFAVRGEGGSCSFKASEVGFAALTDSGRAKPARYLARARWVQFEDLATQDEAEMAGWLAQAHALVAAKLTRAARRELGLI